MTITYVGEKHYLIKEDKNKCAYCDEMFTGFTETLKHMEITIKREIGL